MHTPAFRRALLLAALTGVFAFADATGTRLLAMDSIPNPMAMHATMCPGAPARTLVADGYQVGNSGDTGRQTAANFATQSGARFRTLSNANAAPLAV